MQTTPHSTFQLSSHLVAVRNTWGVSPDYSINENRGRARIWVVWLSGLHPGNLTTIVLPSKEDSDREKDKSNVREISWEINGEVLTGLRRAITLEGSSQTNMGEGLGRKNGEECLSLGGGRTERTSLKQAVSTVVPRGGSKILASEWCQFKHGYGNMGEPESQSSPILI